MDIKTKKQFLSAYDSYGDAIYRHCFFRVYSKAKAEELTQEAYLRMWQYLKEGNEVENMRAFLYRVANNLIIDDVRKKKEESLDAMLEENPAMDPPYDGHKDLERGIEVKEVLEEIQNLSEETRDILIYRYVDDLDPKDISEILGITPNNVSVRLNRAIKLLKKNIGEKEIK